MIDDSRWALAIWTLDEAPGIGRSAYFSQDCVQRIEAGSQLPVIAVLTLPQFHGVSRRRGEQLHANPFNRHAPLAHAFDEAHRSTGIIGKQQGGELCNLATQ